MLPTVLLAVAPASLAPAFPVPAFLVPAFLVPQDRGLGELAAEREGPDEATRGDIDAAIERGVAHLVDVVSGKTGTFEYGARSGARGLVLYTLLKCGADPSQPEVRRLVAELAGEKPNQTYDRACVLLALVAADPVAYGGTIRAIVSELVSSQGHGGGWGYPHGLDLSNTQYAALAIWAASEHGFEVPTETWAKLAKHVISIQDDAGGFGYTEASGATGSMTTAGVGVLAMCEIGLTRASALELDQADALRTARDRGVAWLDKHYTVEQNPGSGGAWHLYYLYGLERAGALAGVRWVGDHDWYKDGATLLVGSQKEDGGWWRGETQTCFALLFLKQATRSYPESGPRRAPKDLRAAHDGNVTVQLVVSGTGPFVFRIAGWGRATRAAFEWPSSRDRGPHVTRVEYLVDGEVVGVLLDDATRPAGMRAFPFEVEFAEPGVHSAQVRVNVLGPPSESGSETRPGEVRIVQSPPLEVVIGEDEVAVREPLVELDTSVNLMLAGQPRLEVSSELSSTEGLPALDYGPGRAVDQDRLRPWLADPEDEDPSIELTLKKPQKADVILIVPAMLTAHEPDFLSRPLELEVRVNSKKYEARAHLDPSRPIRIELEKPVSVRRLVISIPWKVPGKGHASVGIGEVELFLSSE